MENLLGNIGPGVLEPPTESSCKCFNILSGPMKLSCLHMSEDNRCAGVSKVSQIATMFQPHQDYEEKDDCLGPSQASVVRTESHVARFNTARALFEKMAEQKAGGVDRKVSKDASKRRGVGGGTGGVCGGRGTPSPSSSGGNTLSRSPSPCSPRSLIHSNGFSSHPPRSISNSGSPIPTISSLSSTSPPTPSAFHSSINNPPITSSVLPHHPGANILSPRTFSDATDSSSVGRWTPVVKPEMGLPERLNERNKETRPTDRVVGHKTQSSSFQSTPIIYNNVNDRNRHKSEEDRQHTTNSCREVPLKTSSANIKLDSSSKQEVNSKFFAVNHTDGITGNHAEDRFQAKYDAQVTGVCGAKSDNFAKPAKPTKPDLSDKRLNSSHLQNQQLIQRHKNWFHTFSKTKSPVSSPNKLESSQIDSHTGGSMVENRLMSTYEDSIPKESSTGKIYSNTDGDDIGYRSQKSNHSRKVINEVSFHKRKSLDDLDSISSEEIQSAHNDWRRERAAILAGRTNSRLNNGEDSGKTSGGKTPQVSEEEKVRNYDDVSTLPSYWCPPKQYNATAKTSRSNSIPTGPTTGDIRPSSSGDNREDDVPSPQNEPPHFSDSSGSGYVVKREITEVHRSTFDLQRDHVGSSPKPDEGKELRGSASPTPSDCSTASSRKSDVSRTKHDSRASSDLVNERLQRRQSNEIRNNDSSQSTGKATSSESEVKLRKYKAMSVEDVSSNKRSSIEVKLDLKEGSLKRNSYEVDREKRLKEWERKRIERGNRLSDEIKVHNIRVSDISAFTKNATAEKEKRDNDEVIWVKREPSPNTGSLDSRRKRRDDNRLIRDEEERKRNYEEAEKKRKESLERTHKEEIEREEIKRRKMEELDRKRKEEVERKKLEERLRQKMEDEERRRQEELECKRKEEQERRRKQEEESNRRKMELENKRLEEERMRKENERLEREMAEKFRIQKEEEERVRQQKLEEERIRQQKLEEERIRQQKLEEERLRQQKLEEERIRQQKLEEERLRQQKLEEERLRQQKLEEEIIRQQKLEEERLRQQKLEEERIRQQKLEEERIRQQKLEEERIRQKELEEERLRQRRKEEERLIKEAEEMEVQSKIEKERETKANEELENKRKEEEERKKLEESRRKKEERERRRLEEEEYQKLQEEEILRKEKEEIEKIKDEVIKRKAMEEEEKRLTRQKFEDEEKEKREKDRMEIEKTKRRIAELKREREELQRQQLMRMQQILVPEKDNAEQEQEKVKVEKEEVIRINLDQMSSEDRELDSIAALDALVLGHHPRKKSDPGPPPELAPTLDETSECSEPTLGPKDVATTAPRLDRGDTLEFLDENKSSNIEYALVDSSEITDIETTEVDVTEVDQSTSSNNSSTSHTTDRSAPERLEEPAAIKVEDQRRIYDVTSSLVDDAIQQPPGDDVYYDPTVTSAQYKLEFCSSPLGISAINRDDSKSIPYRSQIINSSTVSSEFEPLPPPIPPHNVNPADIMQEGVGEPPEVTLQEEEPKEPERVEVSSEDGLEKMADFLEYADADPEVMTPEEESKLLSHKLESSLLSDDQAQEVKQILSQTKSDVADGGCLSSPVQSPDIPKVLPDITQHLQDNSMRVSSPPVDYNEEVDDDVSGVPVGQVTAEGYVVRTKEVHYEDGIHYFEDGNFWIEVPGLPENDDEDEDDDEFPEPIPFHKHTKLKFSTAPIQLFSTFSVTDYDRKNEDVDPVAASAEYELEKRVEKMDVFPVQIEKGEGGLGLSIIGMGVGADAGVEKLGIFVKTISPGGATEKDGRIRVNDQIIEVDSQSLVGVTQMYAASVLKNTNGTVNFLIGREQDPENSEVAMLIRQSLMADLERDERRRALGGPNYDPSTGGVFESFSSPSGGDSPSEETSRNNISQYDEVGDANPYGEEGCEDDYADSFGSCPSSPQPRVSSNTESLKHNVENSSSEMVMMSQHLMEVQHKNRLHQEEITILRSKINELEKELGDKVEVSKSLEEMTTRLIDIEDKLQSRQAEIATYQDMLEQSQGQYIVLEKKYYKAKKIIKEYQSRERDFLHREEYHITQLEEKDALYNSLVKALKDRVIQLEGDLIKAQQQAGLPIVIPPDLNAQSSNFIHSSNRSSKILENEANLDHKEPPRKPATLGTLDPDLSDTEGCDTHTSESSKASTVERKIPLKEELDVAIPPHELLDVSFSKAKGELAARGGLANRQLPSLKKTASSSSAGSFDRSLDGSIDDVLLESQPQLSITGESHTSSIATVTTSNISSNSYSRHDEVFQQTVNTSNHSISSSTSQHQVSQTSSFPHHNGFGRPPPPYHPPQGHNLPSYSSNQSPFPHGQPHQSPYGSSNNDTQHIQNQSHQSQPPPYQPPPSAPLSHRSLGASEAIGRSDMPYRHPPPIARVQPVNRVETPPDKPPTPTSPQYGPRTPQQQSLAHQLKTLLAEREATSEHSATQGNVPQSPIKKSASMLMEDVRQAVMQADLSIGKKPVISGPIHVSSTAQVVSTGQFVQHRGSPVRNSGGNSNNQQRANQDFGSWSPKLGRNSQHVSSSIVAPSNTSGVVLLSQRPIDSSLPPLNNEECNLSSSSMDHLATGSQGSLVDNGSTSSFDSQPSPSHLQDKSRLPGYPRDAVSVLDWTKEQVGQWLVMQGLEVQVGKFVSMGITGPRLVNIDTKDLKTMGLTTDEKNKIKRKVKELRQNLEKERKQIEKERKEREKLQKKAEKLAKEAEKRKK